MTATLQQATWNRIFKSFYARVILILDLQSVIFQNKYYYYYCKIKTITRAYICSRQHALKGFTASAEIGLQNKGSR